MLSLTFRVLSKFYPLGKSCVQRRSGLHPLLQSYYTSCYEGKDPGPYFFNREVQSMMKKLTGFELDKIFKKRHLESPELTEEFKFFTKEDLEEYMKQSTIEGYRLLQMPPVVKLREPINEILSKDPAIQNPEESNKIIITDISFGVSDRERIIVVREPDGTLRQAHWDERDRMNQIYNPRKGRYIKMPQAFEEEHLKGILDRGDYIFILDFASAQFEPDDTHYHRVTEVAYEHVRKNNRFGDLYSTRYFGPMCFYYAWTRKIDELLIYYIERERIDDAATLIHLFYVIHDKQQLPAEQSSDHEINLIKKYADEDSKLKGKIQFAIQTYQESQNEKQRLEQTIKSSHGIS